MYPGFSKPSADSLQKSRGISRRSRQYTEQGGETFAGKMEKRSRKTGKTHEGRGRSHHPGSALSVLRRVHPEPGRQEADHRLGRRHRDGAVQHFIRYRRRGSRGRDAAVRFMDGLKLANIATHVAASKTMVLHPASHTHRQMNDEQLREAGVSPGMIRLSVGIESAKDIINDLKEALENA